MSNHNFIACEIPNCAECAEIAEAAKETYQRFNIVRVYRSGGRKRKVLHRGVTLQVAQLHCNDPLTSTSTYMDVYERV